MQNSKDNAEGSIDQDREKESIARGKKNQEKESQKEN